MHNRKNIILLLVCIISFIKVAAFPAVTEPSINDNTNTLDALLQKEYDNNEKIISDHETVKSKREDTQTPMQQPLQYPQYPPQSQYPQQQYPQPTLTNNDYGYHNNDEDQGNNQYDQNNSKISPFGTSSDDTNPQNDTNSQNDTNPQNDNNKEQSFFVQYKIYIMVLIIILVVIIILIFGICICKRKYNKKNPNFKAGNLMEKIEANNNYDIINLNLNDIINTSMTMQTMPTMQNKPKTNNVSDINTSALIKEGEYNNNNNNNNNNKPVNIEFLQKGLKPSPHTHEIKPRKKRILRMSKSPLSVTTTFPRNKSLNVPKLFRPSNRESYMSDASVAPTMISQVSSNGGGLYSCKNNALNKHISVAMTFGFDKDEEESGNCPTPNSRASVANSKIGSPRSLSSYISTSPITQSFKRFFPASPRRSNYVVIDTTKKSDLEGAIYLNEESTTKYTTKLNSNKNIQSLQSCIINEKPSSNRVKFNSPKSHTDDVLPSEVESIINNYDIKSEISVVNQ